MYFQFFQFKLEDDFIGDVMAKDIEQLNSSKDALMNALTGNVNKDFLDQNLANIDTRIDELKQKFRTVKDTYKSVNLEWDVELEDKLSLTVDILLTRKQVRQCRNINMPVVTFGKCSNEETSPPGVFCRPTGLTIDPTTNYLYICDKIKNCVQVFNKSFEFLFQFSDMMESPAGICVNHDKVYVSQYRFLTVYSTDGQYLPFIGGKGKDHSRLDDPRGLDIIHC